MIEEILSLGNKVEIREISRNMGEADLNDESRKTYVSQILEFDDEDENLISVAMPIYEGRLVPLEIGSRFDVYFYAKKGIFHAQATITKRYKSGNIYIMVIELNTALKKYQRRQFFRLDTNVQFKYKLFTKEDEKYFRTMGKLSEEMLNRPFSGGVSLDISGGGIRYVSREQLNKGDTVFVQIEVNDEHEKFVSEPIARVLSSIPAKGRSGVYETRIEFVQIKDSERERLIKFIFREERRMRKK
ncbi:MAG: flagellar brake protein [Lachnospiraceae bacterium]